MQNLAEFKFYTHDPRVLKLISDYIDLKSNKKMQGYYTTQKLSIYQIVVDKSKNGKMEDQVENMLKDKNSDALK